MADGEKKLAQNFGTFIKQFKWRHCDNDDSIYDENDKCDENCNKPNRTGDVPWIEE